MIQTLNYIGAFIKYHKAKKILKQEEKEQRKEEMRKHKGVFACKTYPWSILSRCKCGNKHPWMHGFPSTPPYNEMVEDGSIYRVVCHRCFRHTNKGTYRQVVDEWNNRMEVDYKQIIDEWNNRNKNR